MIFREAKLKGSYIIELERIQDKRGFFARSWCQKEFEEKGLNSKLVQCNISYNMQKGLLRGMHYQSEPHAEAKLVRCTKGAIYDVIVDLRPGSKTYKKWMSVELTDRNRKMIYIPEGFAHGFQTLSEETEVFYQMSTFYVPACAKGVRWNDEAFAIQWPEKVSLISKKDQSYPDFKDGNV